MYIYNHVKYLLFSRIEFSNLSVIRDLKGFLFIYFLFFLLPKFPFPSFSQPPPTYPHSLLLSYFPLNKYLTGCLFFLCMEGGRSGEWYWRDLPSEFQCFNQELKENKTLDSKYKAEAWLKPQERLGFVVGSQPYSKLLRSWLLWWRMRCKQAELLLNLEEMLGNPK